MFLLHIWPKILLKQIFQDPKFLLYQNVLGPKNIVIKTFFIDTWRKDNIKSVNLFFRGEQILASSKGSGSENKHLRTASEQNF